MGIAIAFVVTIALFFGGKYLPLNLSLIGPLLGGFIAGCIVGKSYLDGFVNGGIPAGIGAIFLIIMSFIFWGGINIGTSFGTIISGTFIVIPYFIAFFIIGSIGGIAGVALRKKIKN